MVTACKFYQDWTALTEYCKNVMRFVKIHQIVAKTHSVKVGTCFQAFPLQSPMKVLALEYFSKCVSSATISSNLEEMKVIHYVLYIGPKAPLSCQRAIRVLSNLFSKFGFEICAYLDMQELLKLYTVQEGFIATVSASGVTTSSSTHEVKAIPSTMEQMRNMFILFEFVI